MRSRFSVALVAMAALSAACGGSDPVEPNVPREEVAGAYGLVSLVFDPLGSLPAVDVRGRLAAAGKPDPSLALLADGQLQLLFEDPGSRLLRLVEGTFRTTPTGATLDFGSAGTQRALLLPRSATFERRGDGSLALDDDGASVSRAALVALAPELAGEQLLDPVPGALSVVFGRAP